ncbi:MAG: GntR family transcriptional regulator [Pseudorhodobacter sp.]|nr:GntR family transcriptional regulator [Pseudorhodobacter sp.]
MFTIEKAVEKPGGRLSEDEIVERIFDAVIDQRLPPGSKLSESALCEAFGASRMHVRRSLLVLASRDVVELQSNRGAFVASPTAEQAHEVFEARLIIEPDVARMAAERATVADVQSLATHVGNEVSAHKTGNRHEAIRLSGQFHVAVARICANKVMERMVKELVTRTSLIIGIFGAPGLVNCRDDDHMDILEAIKTKDQESAAELMVSHLMHIQGNLDLSNGRRSVVDLVQIFSQS